LAGFEAKPRGIEDDEDERGCRGGSRIAAGMEAAERHGRPTAARGRSIGARPEFWRGRLGRARTKERRTGRGRACPSGGNGGARARAWREGERRTPGGNRGRYKLWVAAERIADEHG